MRIRLSKHVESEIAVVRDAAAGLVVRKQYKPEVPCVAWLNQELRRWYDAGAGMPVAQHEYRALQLLAPHGIVPQPLALEGDVLVMTYCGDSLEFRPRISRQSYEEQAARIVALLAQLGFRHNDMLPRNVVVQDGTVRLVDFTLAEFGDVELMAHLPQPQWARPGRDQDMVAFLREETVRPRFGAGPLNRLLQGMERWFR